ncbi:Paraquat-inducible protein B [Vibrio thalassae]|uniref:Paraquat-inducible protein B n=1 Tax=Vibrio thalassae TaxID=1243014 RepID=A0A240EN31_9VIBR|nr:MlaD family protein [Vibrio thalassae]SNX50068.1 Paraquat-inducible protein B [Vibrio thalassae]
MSNENQQQKYYSPDIKKDRRISPLWILPILTIALAGWLLVKAVHDAGQRVQIYFSDAQGLIAGRTTIRYQGLEVGMVRDINLSEDLTNIYVDADIYPEATKLLGEDTKFWLVKPSASLSGISGLDALVSGNYIAIFPATKSDSAKSKYVALESVPTELAVNDGLTVTLKAKDLGGISVGSKIVYKKIPIGEVYSFKLDSNAETVSINASIQNEFSHIITDKSRFWNVSGIGASVGFQGVDIRLESLSAILAGAIAVDSPDGGEPVKAGTDFRLYKDLKTAGRGIPIQIALPDNSNLKANGSPIMYRGLEIGRINNLALNGKRDSIIASASIEPAFSDMLNQGTLFLLEEAKVSLSGVENLSNLITGNFLTLVPGNGNQARDFIAVKQDELDRVQAKSISIRLLSENSFGLEPGSSVLYRGIPVGTLNSVELINDQVAMDIAIDIEYKDLIRSQNRFFVTGSATAELTKAGLSVTVPPAKQLLTGSISFVSEGAKTERAEFALFQTKSLAELAKHDQTGSMRLTLFADELPPIQEGSPVLYRNMQVGSVSNYSLTDGGVYIHTSIDNKYKHLVTPQTVFWNRSGVEIDASLSGVHVKAAPLKTLIDGGIAFDNMPGIDNKTGKNWKLYQDFNSARKFGQSITLYTTTTEQQVNKGMALKYQGVKVGEVMLTVPDFEKERVEVIARILPEYVHQLTTASTYYWIVKPQIGLNGVKNLSAIVSQYIAVEPGKGKNAKVFELNDFPKVENGVEFTLQSETRGSIKPGTPILYRDIEVGRVTSVELGTFADRVISNIQIDPHYAYLVRANSVFWNVSGLDVQIGLSGANIKAGTVDSLIRGGITFSTPEGNQLQPKAKPGQSFYLNKSAEEKWTKWRTAIPSH